ncbi:hypothetical protein SASPL_154826 [Salvia splendens]|uniref:Reverse transcriptase Ty1/copia-type domain-containing protein n=1 Tax=Salvia splendens TaxID=180675 RepID=A0A8X8W0T6_SALSN|nr:hypothetical protein SASPL_154826 [Salvia splendens]
MLEHLVARMARVEARMDEYDCRPSSPRHPHRPEPDPPDTAIPPIGTTIKLNGSNYMLWSRAFLLFLGSQKKKSHVQTAPPATTDANYDTCAKAMWDALREMFFNDKNVSRLNGYSDDIPTLSNALSRVLRVSTGRTESTSFDNSAMSARGRGSYGGRGRGQGRGRGRGRGFHDRLCDHCGRSNHESDKCWKKFGKPDWANNIEFAAPSSSSTTTDASTSVAAFAVSPGKSWMLDSGASTHITGTKSLLTSFSPSSLQSIRLADGNYSPVTGTGVVNPTTHITLDNVLFAPNFPDLQTKRTIGGGHERGGLYYLDNVSPVSPSALLSVALSSWMPSSVLHGDIPFSCLHPDKPLYHIPPRIFGCTCFVHDLTPGLDKLSPRSIKCVYTRRRRPATAPEAPETVPTVSCPLPQSSSPPASEDPPPSDELPIAIRKVIPTSYQEALKHPLWRAAMDEEMRALLSRASGIVILIVYVDDILISGSDVRGIEETKKYLQQHFVIKDLGRPKYFLGIEIAHGNSGVSLSQQKYATDLLKETGLLGAKPVDTPMEVDPSV